MSRKRRDVSAISGSLPMPEEALTRAADHHQWDFAQIQLNYYDWKYGNAAKEYKVLEERNIPIVVMEQIRDNVNTFEEAEELSDADAASLSGETGSNVKNEFWKKRLHLKSNDRTLFFVVDLSGTEPASERYGSSVRRPS